MMNETLCRWWTAIRTVVMAHAMGQRGGSCGNAAPAGPTCSLVGAHAQGLSRLGLASGPCVPAA